MAESETELTIGETAELAGVPPSTLRYWESAGLLTPPRRLGGKRRYGAVALRQIGMISLAKRAGFSLTETKIVLAGFSEKTPPPEIWRSLASRKLPEIERTLTEATAMKRVLEEGLECDCLSLDDCLRRVDSATGRSV